eukprot:SAG31_NODE_40744_length_279_cov_0.844444_1_plen_85_part_10
MRKSVVDASLVNHWLVLAYGHHFRTVLRCARFTGRSPIRRTPGRLQSRLARPERAHSMSMYALNLTQTAGPVEGYVAPARVFPAI